jgi:hypothetical protein
MKLAQTEKVLVTLYIHIQQALDSNLCLNTRYPDRIFIGFLSLYNKRTGYNLGQVTTVSIHIFPMHYSRTIKPLDGIY